MTNFFTPTELRVTPTGIERVMLLGGCMFDKWGEVLKDKHPHLKIEHANFDYGGAFSGQEDPCDLRLAQIPLRFLYPEAIVMQGRYDDLAWYEQALEQSFARLRNTVQKLGGGSTERPTFFLNYALPQGSTMGRLLPRYDVRNPTFYIQRLNRRLNDLIDRYPGGHILDVEQVAARIGRRFMQDDAFWLSGHGGMIEDFDATQDINRLEVSEPLSQRYPHDVPAFIEAAWAEAEASLRTLRGLDRVKMVCVDLDDTLWRGVLAEADAADPSMVEGWPTGFAEALMVLRQRGIILAIISKNDEAVATQIMDRLYVGRLKMSDFAIRKINWRPKPQNMIEAIREANVLPESVIYIDDNPVERAAVKHALPGVRTLGAPHLDWRRILLWSSETQVPFVSTESAQRTEMVQAQVARETDRQEMTDADFLATLDVTVTLRAITQSDDPQFARALELINKTNQFNTTGVRWTERAASDHFADNGKWWVFSVRDRYTSYGLVGVAILKDDHVAQFVMSCRVFGLGVEQAVLGAIENSEGRALSGAMIETERNGPGRQLFQKSGWKAEGGRWISAATTIAPAHVSLEYT